MTNTKSARDLEVGDVISTQETDASGAWVTVGATVIEWGAVTVLDLEGNRVTTFNHGDPVRLKEEA